MDFIKRYLSIIIPGAILVVGLVFVVLMFVVNSGVSAQMEQSVSTGRNVTQLAASVPSKDQPQVEAAYQSRHEEDADRIEQLFLAATTRELVAYNIFPKPVDTSRQIFTNFGIAYRKAIEEMIVGMSAADAPSVSEISAVTASTGTRTRSEESDLIVDAYCKDKALKAKVYAAPTILPWFDFWRDYKFVSERIAVDDCWNSQVALWVYQDVAETIKQLNQDSRSIMDGPVKRLVGISFNQSADGAVSARGARSVTMDLPGYVTEQSPPFLVSDTWTTRESNEDIDVIHFSVSVIVAVDKVPEFMKSLCSVKSHLFYGWDGKSPAKECQRNQITVLSFNTVPVDRENDFNKYYRYGKSAVVQWTGVCEYIFARKAYDEVMPQTIKDKITGQVQQQ